MMSAPGPRPGRLGAVRQPHALAVDEQVAHRAHRLARGRARPRPDAGRPHRRDRGPAAGDGDRVTASTAATRAVTDAGTGVPASTDHGDGSGAPATTRNGTTPDQASVSSSGTEAPPERSLSSQRPGVIGSSIASVATSSRRFIARTSAGRPGISRSESSSSAVVRSASPSGVSSPWMTADR